MKHVYRLKLEEWVEVVLPPSSQGLQGEMTSGSFVIMADVSTFHGSISGQSSQASKPWGDSSVTAILLEPYYSMPPQL